MVGASKVILPASVNAKLLPTPMSIAIEAASVRDVTLPMTGAVKVLAAVIELATDALTNLTSAADTGIRFASAVPKSKLAAVPSPRPTALV